MKVCAYFRIFHVTWCLCFIYILYLYIAVAAGPPEGSIEEMMGKAWMHPVAVLMDMDAKEKEIEGWMVATWYTQVLQLKSAVEKETSTLE